MDVPIVADNITDLKPKLREKKLKRGPVLTIAVTEKPLPPEYVEVAYSLYGSKELLTTVMLELIKELLIYDRPDQVAEIKELLERYRDS